MATSATEDHLIRQALAEYSIGQVCSWSFHSGTAAKTWRVETDCGTYLLRTRGPRTSADAMIRFDHSLRRHLLQHDIPTAAPVSTRSGNSHVRLDDRVLELYRLLPGRTLSETNNTQLAEVAASLARFHRATETFSLARELPPVAQYRTLGVETESARMEAPTLLRMIYDSVLAPPHSAEWENACDMARAWLHRLAADYGDEMFDALPHVVTHGDFTLANILFDTAGSVCGIFDFDWSRWAPRVRDIADGMYFVSGVRRSPLVPSDIWSLTATADLTVSRCVIWLKAYAEINPLEEAELQAIPLAFAARWLSVRVEGMAKVPEADRIRFALENLAEPLAWLEAHWHEVKTTVAQ